MTTALPRSLRAQDFDLRWLRGVSATRALYRFLAGYRGVYAAALAALAIAAAARAAFAYVIRFFIDEALLAGRYERIPWASLSFLILAAVSGSLTFWGGRQAARAAEGAVRRLRVFLYDHLQHLPFSYHDHMQTGELIQRSSSDVEEVRRLFAEHGAGLARIATLFTMSFVAMFRLHPALALVSALVVPLAVFASVRFWQRLARIYNAFQDQEARLSSLLQQNLYGARVVRAFSREAYEISRFEGANALLYQRGRRMVRFHNIYWPSMDVLLAIQTVGSTLLGAWMAIEGLISPGTYLAFTGLLGLMIGPIRHLGRLFALSAQSRVSFDRISQIIAERREQLEAGDYAPAQELQGHVRYEDVSFAYEAPARASTEMRNPPVVLRRVTFEAEAGSVIAILSPTGSGKTSLVNLLPRFYDYTDGRILLDGVELSRYPRRLLRRHIGIVQQEPFLFSRSLRDNITYGTERACTDAEVTAAAQAANIHDSIQTFAQGYDTVVGEQGATLSGGQRQRLAIARTLLKNPRILILDDATSAVDADTEKSIREALQRLMRGRTTFVIAHRIASIAQADKILVMEAGRIVQAGTHAELAAREGLYRDVFRLQMNIERKLTEEIQAALAPEEKRHDGG